MPYMRIEVRFHPTKANIVLPRPARLMHIILPFQYAVVIRPFHVGNRNRTGWSKREDYPGATSGNWNAVWARACPEEIRSSLKTVNGATCQWWKMFEY